MEIALSYFERAIRATAGLTAIAYMMGYEEKYVFYVGIAGILIFSFIALFDLYERKKK